MMHRQSKVKLMIAAALLGIVAGVRAASYADAVVAYEPGTGFATEFGSGEGLTNSAAALGEPSRVNPGEFGGPVTPFNPPFQPMQLTSIGEGGSLTVRFERPIPNDPNHPFGLEFNIFGSAGFTITNGDFSGGGITDGTLFSHNPGGSRVSVSADNSTYYTLDPDRAPAVDTLFPTDGSGDFQLPVDPALSHSDFAGMDLDGIRALYDRSAGGAGYDIGWAVDVDGQPVDLSSIRFVRVEGISGHTEIDGFTAVPEPVTWLLGALGGALLALGRIGRRKGDAEVGPRRPAGFDTGSSS
jgi:hypothetical protein